MALNKYIVDITRQLRRNQTPSEDLLWGELRNRKLKGFKFLRQHPIVYGESEFAPLFFVADFYCSEKKLVLEIDGRYHDFQKDFDENRDSILAELGLTTIRIKNEDLINMKQVLSVIEGHLTQSELTLPSLRSREGRPAKRSRGEFGIIVLAAGSSSRMGKSKQLLEVNNEPLLVRSVKAAIASELRPVIVVLGANEKEHYKAIEHLGVNIIKNPDWEKGMGGSIKTGLNHLLKHSPKAEGAMVMVCDQPLLTAEHLKMLWDRHRETHKPLIASRYADTTGVPAFFHKSLFSKILDLPDTDGAKKIIQQHPSETVTVDFPGGSVDLDTPEDYKNFVSKSAK